MARLGHMAFGNPAEILGYAGHPPSIQALQGRRDIPARTWKLPFLSGNVYYILQALTMYIVPRPARRVGMEHTPRVNIPI